MNKIILPIATFILVFSTGCEFASLLSGDNQNDDSTRDNAAINKSTLLNLEITGGIAGVQRNFHVSETGEAVFTDSFQPGAKWTLQLTASQLSTIKKLMSDNNFFQLNDAYIDAQVADAFIYTIFYKNEGESKTVQTDGFASPENLNNIIEGLLAFIENTTENGLQLELQLSRTQIKPSETVEMTLLVTNTLDVPLTLKFNSGQIFDFLVADVPPAGSLAPEKLIWNWAHDKAFTQQIWQLDIPAGETNSYSVSWDGRDNKGDSVSGEFVVRANLVSTPGGSPEEKTIVVSK